MNTPSVLYPAPARSEINAPMLDAWAKGELHLQRCGECDHKVYFPRTQCPNCWSTRLEWTRLTGKGKIISFAKVHKHVHASFAMESPTILAEILLEEGWSILARVVAANVNDITSGMRIGLVSGERASQFPLPTFSPRD